MGEVNVSVTGNGDPAKLVSSGFKLRKARGTATLSPIKDLKVTIDQAGEATYLLINQSPVVAGL